MRQNGIGKAERNEGFAHTDFVSEDLNFEAIHWLWIKEPIEQNINRGLLTGGIFQVLDA